MSMSGAVTLLLHDPTTVKNGIYIVNCSFLLGFTLVFSLNSVLVPCCIFLVYVALWCGLVSWCC